MMPAGSLDAEEGLQKKIHSFVAARAPWYEITDALAWREKAPGGSGGRALGALR